MHTLVLLNISPHTKFEVPNFTRSKDMIAPKNYNKKASIRWQDSVPPISGYWPTNEPNAG